MRTKQAIEASSLHLPHFKQVLESKFKQLLSKASKVPVIVFFRQFLDEHKDLLTEAENIALEYEYRQAVQEINQYDALTSLLGLMQALVDQFDIVESKPIYMNIFRMKIKNNANQLKGDVLNALTTYYRSCKTEAQMWEIGDMVVNLSAICTEYMKIAYRIAELDKKEKDSFYSYHNALMKKFGFPITHKESFSNEPLSLEEVENLIKLNNIEYKERKKELNQLKQQLQNNDN